MKLNGKRAVITGAARGIGAGIAKAFAAEGATVIATDIDAAALERTGAALACETLRLDVRSPEDWAALAEAFPSVDIVVNNAGITGFDPPGAAHDPASVSLADWRAVFATNLDGTLLGCQYAIKAISPKTGGAAGGVIINIGSRSGRVGVAQAAAYAASKAAIGNLTKSVALHCASVAPGVTCNAILPGAILTPMWEPMLGPDDVGRADRMAALVADAPLKRFGHVEEIAAVAVMLAGDEAKYITGTEILVDGGLTAGQAAPPPPSDA